MSNLTINLFRNETNVEEYSAGESIFAMNDPGTVMYVVKEGEVEISFEDMLLETCAATVRHPERFAQTGTGWVLRELSRGDMKRVISFIEKNIDYFSNEGLKYATEKMPPETKIRLREMHKTKK